MKKYAGTKGALMVVRDDETESWRILESSLDDTPVDENMDVHVHAGTKRDHEGDHEDEMPAKRTRTFQPSTSSGVDDVAPSGCLAPLPSDKAQEVLGLVSSNPPITTHGQGDVFLTEDWRSRWCKCASVHLFF